ncbi:uncharacterized protein MONOS_16681 [Monocercomonoides exilis]|uniref:uncharacterized protein n=1 Tax=Monocercomonoides exilis TaxID=2049356 RepID=UPI00355A9056|nr:hypothetical protein MONOS_16681 [Monocercomonoides exilis]|eukprot:MONOS_16681.1-p1 / transcript=MONOS_16681.1 / gene=MONOS_16681 / organism=Monocercomonoides_exilis_PA203 / gene_product=unspecified product / transcript_product=unspecified product / location=Mono_scaffold02002:373-2067(-) / protein_length=304 / sequence_SO=supercontig / SO=protein_coding / is_pseudo=false
MVRFAWLGDIPVTKEAVIEELDVMWAPRWTRAWELQMENVDWYIGRALHVVAKAREEQRMFHAAVNFGRNVGSRLLSSARESYRADRINRARKIGADLYGQGRVQNWKQVKQTGVGKKIHRRGRRYKFRLRLQVYNMPFYQAGTPATVYPANSIYSFNDYTHAYIRVISFRKYGSAVTNDVQESLWSMFKYPYLLTSGYVTGFKSRWLKEFGIQLYSDKLLRTDYVRTSLWKFVSGMPLGTGDISRLTITGLPNKNQSVAPRLGGFDEREGSGLSGNEPAGETGATGSTPTPSSSFTILHDDN